MSDKNINDISYLSKIEILASEAEGLKKDLDQMLGYVKRLEELDLSGVEPFYHPHDLTLRVRPDSIENVVGPKALHGSEGFHEDLVRVPRIIE